MECTVATETVSGGGRVAEIRERFERLSSVSNESGSRGGSIFLDPGHLREIRRSRSLGRPASCVAVATTPEPILETPTSAGVAFIGQLRSPFLPPHVRSLSQHSGATPPNTPNDVRTSAGKLLSDSESTRKISSASSAFLSPTPQLQEGKMTIASSPKVHGQSDEVNAKVDDAEQRLNYSPSNDQTSLSLGNEQAVDVASNHDHAISRQFSMTPPVPSPRTTFRSSRTFLPDPPSPPPKLEELSQHIRPVNENNPSRRRVCPRGGCHII